MHQSMDGTERTSVGRNCWSRLRGSGSDARSGKHAKPGRKAHCAMAWGLFAPRCANSIENGERPEISSKRVIEPAIHSGTRSDPRTETKRRTMGSLVTNEEQQNARKRGRPPDKCFLREAKRCYRDHQLRHVAGDKPREPVFFSREFVAEVAWWRMGFLSVTADADRSFGGSAFGITLAWVMVIRTGGGAISA